MTLRRFLLLPLAFSLLLLALHGKEIFETLLFFIGHVRVSVQFVLCIVAAITLQFIGHIVRSKKAVLLFSPVEESRISSQFRAFTIGTLFNSLLPLRLGELIRTAIISQKLNISYIYTFLLIVFERAIDVLVICVLMIVALTLVVESVSLSVVLLLGGLVALASGLIIVIVLLRQPPGWLLSLIYRISLIFNSELKVLVQFKVWSVSYGLNKSIRKRILVPYLKLTFIMWVFYIASTAMVVLALGGAAPLLTFVKSVVPYFGMTTPAGPAGLGVYSHVVDLAIGQGVGMASSTMFDIVTWSLLLVPTSVAGLLLIVKTGEPIWTRRTPGASDASLENKMTRSEDISSELKHFLDSFFIGNKLSKIVHRLELQGRISLVRYFKGGSDAITILVLQDNKRVVKKIIPIELKGRLKAQYDWLKRYGKGDIVRALSQHTAEDYYAIDLAYDQTSVSMFEYAHEVSLSAAQKIMKQAWGALNRSVYGSIQDPVYDPDLLLGYIDKHIYQCIKVAGETDPAILDVVRPKHITINGHRYRNLSTILKEIQEHKQAWQDISTFRRANTVHGDMIMDNLLFSKKTKRVIVIDPAPDGNMVEGPVFDFGKAAQSLYCGYEFLLRDESRVEYLNGAISFSNSKSYRYEELDLYMRNTLAKQLLTEQEQRAILFHAGVLFLRRLKHQVHYTPGNALKFYAVGVRTLNEFLDQYN